MAGKWRPVDGVLLFDKPLEISSNNALQKVRRLYQAEKAGHTGTLDPLATGLLPICFGEAAKFSTGLLESNKTYLAKIRLGQVTTTGDAEGEVVVTKEVNVTDDLFKETLRGMLGQIEQLPPMHSALKHNGKPLYEYIRNGETVERQARIVTIFEIDLLNRCADEFDVRVCCSKGTYVRTLAEDIGKKLGCGAHLRGLRRIGTGPFSVEKSFSYEKLESMSPSERMDCLLPIDCMLLHLPKLELDQVLTNRLAQGQKLGIDHNLPDGGVRLYSEGVFVGVGDLLGRRLAPNRLISSIARQAAQHAKPNAEV